MALTAIQPSGGEKRKPSKLEKAADVFDMLKSMGNIAANVGDVAKSAKMAKYYKKMSED